MWNIFLSNSIFLYLFELLHQKWTEFIYFYSFWKWETSMNAKLYYVETKVYSRLSKSKNRRSNILKLWKFILSFLGNFIHAFCLSECAGWVRESSIHFFLILTIFIISFFYIDGFFCQCYFHPNHSIIYEYILTENVFLLKKFSLDYRVYNY